MQEQTFSMLPPTGYNCDLFYKVELCCVVLNLLNSLAFIPKKSIVNIVKVLQHFVSICKFRTAKSKCTDRFSYHIFHVCCRWKDVCSDLVMIIQDCNHIALRNVAFSSSPDWCLRHAWFHGVKTGDVALKK